MESQDLVSKLADVVANAPAEITAVYLFGSVARGTAGPNSDIDLGILLRESPRATLEGRMLGYEGVLEQQLGRRVQLVVLNDAPSDLVHRVLRDRRLLLDRDRSARLRFEVRSRNEYFDLLPMLQRYRAAALKKAASVPR